MACTGSEASLLECSRYFSIGSTGCDHSSDAGVACTSGEATPLPPHLHPHRIQPGRWGGEEDEGWREGDEGDEEGEGEGREGMRGKEGRG